MKLTKGKLSKLYNKKKQSYKGKRYFKSNKNIKNSTFRNNTNLNLSSKTLKNLFPKKTKSGSHGLSKYRLYGGADTEPIKESPVENVQEKSVEEPSLALATENKEIVGPTVEPVVTENKEMVSPTVEPVSNENKEMVGPNVEPVSTENKEMVGPNVEPVVTENKEMVSPTVEEAPSKVEPALDENGQPIVKPEQEEAPVLDENGQPIMKPEEVASALDENGQPIVKPEEAPVLDENGQPIVKPEQEEAPALDENGQPIVKPEEEETSALDENGQPIVKPEEEEQDQNQQQDQSEYDENNDRMPEEEDQEPPLDENGQPIQDQQFDETDNSGQQITSNEPQMDSSSDLPSNVANSVVTLVDYIASAVAKKMSNSSEGMQNGFDAVSEQANIENTSGGKRQRYTIKNRKQPKNKTR